MALSVAHWRVLSQFHENDALAAKLANHRCIRYLHPARRRRWLFTGALVAGFAALLRRNAAWKEYRELETWMTPLVLFPLLVLLLFGLFRATQRFNRWPALVRRNPQIALHCGFWIVLLALWNMPASFAAGREILLLVALSAPHLLWRCGYMVMAAQRGKDGGATFRDHLFYLWPLWGGTATPFGKGHQYLSQWEAKTDEAYARAVLAGVKLLLLALLWEAAKLVFAAAVYGEAKNPLLRLWGGHSLVVPRVKSLIEGGIGVTLPVAWLSLYLELIWETLELAAQGHLYIGLLRLFGFNVFRNTYKPLLSRSIVDFWNRYHYYFKELLFEFFFLPTYLNYFRRWPKLRIFAAVLASAFVGNIYYHLIQLRTPLLSAQWDRIWQFLAPRSIYCLLLALGIYFSMLRQQRRRGQIDDGQQASWRRWRAIAGVWTFFALVNFWNIKSPATVAERLGVLLSLFGV